jgi:hypothetical protein
MDEVAESSSNTAFTRVQSTTGLAEIGDRAQFAVYRAGSVPPAVELIASLLGRFFVFKASVNVADQMIIVIVADNELLELAILAKFTPDVLVECVEVVLELRRVHSVLGVVCRVLVQVWHEDGLTVGRLDVLSRAAITVTASADFKVERAVDLVKLGTENGSKKIGHDCGSEEERMKCGNNSKYQIRRVGDGGGLEVLRSSIKVQLL